MLKIINHFIFLFLISIFSYTPWIYGEGQYESNEYVEIPIREIESTELTRTIITAHMEHPIEEGKNLIYCSTFQLAWNEMIEKITGEAVRLKNEPEIVSYLNKQLASKKDLSAESYVALAGFVQDGIVEQINVAIKQKFGNTVSQLGYIPENTVFIAYAALVKHLPFATAFLGDYKIYFNTGDKKHRVQAFGSSDFDKSIELQRELMKQVSILFYDDETDECIITLHTTSEIDELILAMVQPQETLLETVEYAMTKIQSSTAIFLSESEVQTLYIPKVMFDIKHEYTELTGKYFKNRGFEQDFISKAIQKIYFKLDEKGANLMSYAIIMSGTGMPKSIIFDRAFLIILKQKDSSLPYLVIWVANPEIMVPVGE